MSLILSGTDGISDIDGTAATPAIRGTDANTGIFFPAADTIAFAEGGAEVMRIDSSGNVGIGTTGPRGVIDVVGSGSSATRNWGYLQGGNVGGINPNAGYSFGLAFGGNFSNGNSETNLVWGQGVGAGQYFSISKWTGTVVTEQMRIDSSGNLQFNAAYGTAAVAYGCRAWVNFNGTGTVAIRASGNVSSITDNGTGDYTVNFTTSMPDANYTAVGNCTTNNAFSVQFVSMFVSAVSNSIVAPTTSGFRMSTREAAGSGRDEEYVIASVFR